MKKYLFLSSASILLLISACSSNQNSPNYSENIKQWRQQRLEELTKPNGWLSLVGLYWLKSGTHTFGADSSNDIIFPPNHAPPFIGKLIIHGKKDITVTIKPDVSVTHNQQQVKQLKLKTDANGEPTKLHLGSLTWYILERSGDLAIRLKDRKSPVLKNFRGLNYFPIDKKWRIKVHFVPYDEPQTVKIPTAVNKLTHVKIPGVLKFTFNGKTYSLQPIEGDDQFFIVFGDQTNGSKTYGGGRFVYIDKPNDDNITYIDFNKAYNPPCAFTKFATCPLPTAKNRLSIAITAGEKNYK